MNPPLAAFPALRTSRLAIHSLAPGDAAALQGVTDDPAITGAVDFLPAPFTLADAGGLIAGQDADNAFLGLWSDGALVGVVGIHARAAGEIEIGYWIGSAWQRRGYAAEGAGAVIAQLRHLYRAHRIVAECRPANHASWNLLQHLGFCATDQQGKRPGRKLLALPDG